MYGRKIRKTTYLRIKKLAPNLGFVAYENQKYTDGHYLPDLVWEKNDKSVGFEVEYGKVSGKKIVGDAFWLCRTFDIGFIQVVNSKRYERFKRLIEDLNEDFKGNVYIISTNIEQIETTLKNKGWV